MQVPNYLNEEKINIPAIGFGTFGSDHISNDLMKESVRNAIIAGYRHIDCASVYANEKSIGEVLKQAMDGSLTGEKIPRSEFWITSKLWNDAHSEKAVYNSFEKSLKDLQLDYLDLYLIHWPFPNYHPPKCNVSSRSKDARSFDIDEFMVTWKELEKIQKKGLSRYIGLSNVTVKKLEQIIGLCEIKPKFVEMELHPYFQQKEMRKYLEDKKINIIGYCPLGSPHRPKRDTTEDDLYDLGDPIIKKIADNHMIHPASICLKWAFSNHIIPIPFSSNKNHIISNLESILKDELTSQEIEELEAIDKNCRLIKGQVFLWEGAKDWKELWDE